MFLYIFIFFVGLLSSDLSGSEEAFKVIEIQADGSHQVIRASGNLDVRKAPCSTFKVALALMGFEENILQDANTPSVPFKKGYIDWLPVWRQSHTPSMWIKHSCVWFSQWLTQKMGFEKFQKYVDLLNYGNRDLSGDVGKNNGLTNAWLSSSLEISPDEQLEFISKLFLETLPISVESQQKTKSMMFVESWDGGWKLYGKTGSGNQLSEDRKQKLKDRQHGWFIGCVTNGTRTFAFVKLIVDSESHTGYASLRARSQAISDLKKILNIYHVNSKL